MSQRAHPELWMWVDPVSGNDTTGTGSKLAPFATIGTAAGWLNSIRKTGGTIFIKALNPAAPINSSVSITADLPMTLAPWGAGVWHLLGGPGNAYGLRILGTSTVTIVRGHVVGQSTAGIRLGDTGQSAAKLVAIDTYAEGAVSGWQTAGVWQQFDAHRCVGKGSTNDGFNIHGDAGVNGVANLYDCIGENCGDEGVSPHDDTILNIVGGHYRNNASAGMTAVNNAVCHISGGAVFDSNGTDLSLGHGGVTYLDNASGSVDGATMTNNTGPGLQVNTTGTVTLGTYTSGLAAGNTQADVRP